MKFVRWLAESAMLKCITEPKYVTPFALNDKFAIFSKPNSPANHNPQTISYFSFSIHRLN